MSKNLIFMLLPMYVVLTSCRTPNMKKVVAKTNVNQINCQEIYPPQLHASLTSLNIKVNRASDLESSCGIAPTPKELILQSCWTENEKLEPAIFVQKDLNELETKRSIIATNGQIIFSHVASEAPTFLEDTARLVDAFNQDAGQTYSIAYGAELFTQVFTEAFCNQESQNDLKSKTPKTYTAFVKMLAQAGPKDEGLGLAGTPAVRPELPAPRSTAAELNPKDPIFKIGVVDRAHSYEANWAQSKSINWKKILVQKPVLILPEKLQEVPVASSIANGQRAGARSLNQTKPLTIMIHGTFASKRAFLGSTMHPESELSTHIAQHYGGSVAAFRWTGENSPKDREVAGQALSEILIKLKNEGYDINIIAHSHGGNIAARAIELAATKLKKSETPMIGEFISLGRPTRTDFATPYKEIDSHIAVIGTKDIVAILGGRGFWRGNYAASDLKNKNSRVITLKVSHKGTLERIIDVLEKAALIRKNEVAELPPFCLGKCRMLQGVMTVLLPPAVIGAATATGVVIYNNSNSDISDLPTEESIDTE